MKEFTVETRDGVRHRVGGDGVGLIGKVKQTLVDALRDAMNGKDERIKELEAAVMSSANNVREERESNAGFRAENASQLAEITELRGKLGAACIRIGELTQEIEALAADNIAMKVIINKPAPVAVPVPVPVPVEGFFKRLLKRIGLCK